MKTLGPPRKARSQQQDALNEDVPLHHQIYLHLRSQISDGGWVGRDDFPGENELARQFGVSVATSRKALIRLVAEGLLLRGRGRRPQVVQRAEPVRRNGALHVIQTTIGAPRPFTYKILSTGVAVAPVEACKVFGLEPGAHLWQCSRLRKFEGHAHSVTLNVQHQELGGQLPLAKLQRMPMTQVLRESGVRFARLSRRMRAALAPPNVAAHLGLTLNDPTLVYTFTHFDEADRAVQWVRIWVRYDEPSPEEVFDYSTETWSMSTTM